MFLLFAVAFKCMHVREIEWEEGGANKCDYVFILGGGVILFRKALRMAMSYEMRSINKV